MPLSDNEKLDWLRLIRSENVGPRTFHNLIAHYGSARRALEVLPDLARRGGSLISPRICSERDAETEFQRLTRLGARLIALGEEDYPHLLAASDGPPPLITVLGHVPALHKPMVGIVGARNASAAGRTFAKRLAHDLGEAGFTVVSGLARGIDAATHDGSLTTGTVAALAGGVDRLYPPEHAQLAQNICETGALVSEMPLGWEPRAKDFPRRNRIIAGLSHGVVVVEAAFRSGSLITARLALDMGREVMAAPGSPVDTRCDGSNNLLRQGATLVTKAAHVIEAINTTLDSIHIPSVCEESAEPLSSYDSNADLDAPGRIIQLLGPTPTSIDELARLAVTDIRTVQHTLLELELAGRLERSSGGQISLRN